MTYSQPSQYSGNYFLETPDRLKPPELHLLFLVWSLFFKLKSTALSANENFFFSPSGNTYKTVHKLNVPTYQMLGLAHLLG